MKIIQGDHSYSTLGLDIKDKDGKEHTILDIDLPNSFDDYWFTIQVEEIVEWLNKQGFKIINEEKGLELTKIEDIFVETEEEIKEKEEHERKWEEEKNKLKIFLEALKEVLEKEEQKEVEK